MEPPALKQNDFIGTQKQLRLDYLSYTRYHSSCDSKLVFESSVLLTCSHMVSKRNKGTAENNYLIQLLLK